jgi:F-type H+-transporting ATPase subunit gamma
MKTLEELRRRIGSVEEMQSVVSTMKTLAAARIRQFETAAEATRAYSETVYQALQILMRSREPATTRDVQTDQMSRIGYVLLGSDQGFCGRFNEAVSQAAVRFVEEDAETRKLPRPPLMLTVGSRLNQLMLDSGFEIDRTIHVPKSVTDITTVINEVTTRIEYWRSQYDVRRIELFYNLRRSAATYDVKQLQLMPLSKQFLNQLHQKKWESRCLPIYHLPWHELFTSVIGHYLFLALFRACAESLASENASRIAAMHQAEKNIEERLSVLNSQFNQNRQRAVTEELLDIMSGFEAVTGRD